MALAALCGLLLSACDPSPETPEPSPTTPPTVAVEGPGTLRWALGADPTSLDPRRIVRDDDALVVDALFDSLTRLGADQQAEPALAVSWTASDDATTFLFDLDPTASWHDGTPVVADDVVRGLRRVADATVEPVSVHAPLLRDVVGYAAAREGLPLRGVTAVGDTQVRIELTRSVPELPEVLAHPALAPTPVAAVEDPAAFGESPVGNGPFRLAEAWAHNQFLRLAPSETHPAPTNVDEIVFRVYASDEDREIRHADLLAGQIQVSQLPLGRRDEVVATLGVADDERGASAGVHEGLTDTVSLLLFDTRVAPFDDARFRRGVSLLVDRASLASRTDGARVAADSLVPPVLEGGRPGQCVWCRYDPNAAEALIAQVLTERGEAGLETPPVVIQTSTDALHSTLADQLSASLRGVGLEVRVVRPDAAGYLDAASEEGSAVIRLAWSPDEPSMRSWTERFLGPGSTGARVTGWQPGSLRDLLANATESDDRAVRQRAWQQVERLALDAAVVAPVLFYRDDLVVADGVEGLRRDPYGNVDLARVRVGGGDR